MKQRATFDGYLSIGQVLRPQGLKGTVKVRPDTDDPGRFLALDAVFLSGKENKLEKVEVRDVSVRGEFVVLRLGEDQDVDAAEKRRDALLFVLREEAVPLKENENFISDLVSCQVVDTKGLVLGTLKEVLQPGANDVYVVSTAKGDLLIPALLKVILEVDIPNKRIVVDENVLPEVSVLAD